VTPLAQPERLTTDRGREHSRMGQVAAAPPLVETSATAEARSASRLPASLVPSITAVRLSPHGADATLLNISASGVLVECATRFRLGTAVTAVFEGTFSPSSVEGRVARYHIGIAFNKPIPLQEAPTAAVRQPEATPQTPSATPARSVVSNRW